MKATTKYDDIIHLPHHVSKTRPQMPIADRAAQFSPFAALTGHESAIKETARLTNQRIELAEDEKHLLNEKMKILMENIQNHPWVRIIHFQEDCSKEGGAYICTENYIKKIDQNNHCLIMEDDLRILLEDIFDITQ